MESNKPLSVHMTHNEYEQYKKYLAFIKSKGKVIFHGRREEELYGHKIKVEHNIYSSKEVKDIADSFLKDHIAKLEAKNKALKEELAKSTKEMAKFITSTNVESDNIAKDMTISKPRRKGWLPWN